MKLYTETRLRMMRLDFIIQTSHEEERKKWIAETLKHVFKFKASEMLFEKKRSRKNDLNNRKSS